MTTMTATITSINPRRRRHSSSAKGARRPSKLAYRFASKSMDATLGTSPGLTCMPGIPFGPSARNARAIPSPMKP